MATQVDVSSAELSAEMVGHAFVSQFYHILHNSPELVQRFFQDTSTMSRPGPDGVLMTVNAMKGINDLILSLDCKDYKAEILTADAQASHMNGVIVLVTGCLTGKDNVRRKFTESFFLAPQDKGYYVLNDAFRFVEEDSLPVANTVEEEDLDRSDPATSSTIVVEKLDGSDDAVENNTASEDSIIVNHKDVAVSNDEENLAVNETAIPQAPVEPNHSAQAVAEASSNGHANGPKKSYASLLKNMKDGTSTLVRVAAPVAKAAAPNTAQQPVASPAAQQPQADAVPAIATNASVPNGGSNNGAASAADEVDDKGHSIYIGDLPWDATTELVEQEFKKFGRIKRNGIQVRSNKGYCFGFVEYEDASGKQKAIEMGTLRIGGKEAFIQEKKTTTRVVNGVSTYPSGRGGFRNDGFRGRGGYSNGRGYPRNDYTKRNGEVPFRGNRGGEGYQGAYQNGGGRGGLRQAGAPK